MISVKMLVDVLNTYNKFCIEVKNKEDEEKIFELLRARAVKWVTLVEVTQPVSSFGNFKKFPYFIHHDRNQIFWNVVRNVDFPLHIIDSDTDFETQEEVWSYLINEKGIVKYRPGCIEYTLCFKNGFLVDFLTGGINRGLCLSEVDKVKKYIEPKWYDNIPEQGVLCWVGLQANSQNTVAIIKEYDKDNGKAKFKGPDVNCPYATPLTEEEVKQYIYKEN